jgi:AcrR family transcriptional regulator
VVRYDQTEPRGRRARNSLTRAEIADAARDILSSDGAGALTMRAVAQRLGAAPMALYTHVASKEQLLDEVLDAVLSELLRGEDRLVDDPSRPWTEVVVGFGERHLALLAANPWAVPVLLARPAPGAAATAVGELYLATALRGGASARTAVEAFTGVIAVVYGAAGLLNSAAAATDAQSRADVEQQIAETQAGLFPATEAVAPQLARFGSSDQVHDILTALVDGLARGQEPGVE